MPTIKQQCLEGIKHITEKYGKANWKPIVELIEEQLKTIDVHFVSPRFIDNYNAVFCLLSIMYKDVESVETKQIPGITCKAHVIPKVNNTDDWGVIVHYNEEQLNRPTETVD